MADLPDFLSEIVSAAVEATSFRSGLDADKPASPAAGDIWLARDTLILYICAVAGAWTGFDAAQLIQGTLTLYANALGGGYRITNIADPTAAQDAATRAYVLAQKALCLLLAGGTMSGAIAMGANKITGLANPTDAQDAATKYYADTKLADVVDDTTPQLGGELDAQSNKIVSLGAPTAAADAARKTEVDTVDAKLDDASHAEPTRALDTPYQNDSGKIKVVTVSVYLTAEEEANALIGTGSPPTTIVAQADNVESGASTIAMSMTFIVPVDYYYEVESTSGTPLLLDWHEWDLH